MLNNARETRLRFRQKSLNGGMNLLSRNLSGKLLVKSIKRFQRSLRLVEVEGEIVSAVHVAVIREGRLVVVELKGGAIDPPMAGEEEMGLVGMAGVAELVEVGDMVIGTETGTVEEIEDRNLVPLLQLRIQFRRRRRSLVFQLLLPMSRLQRVHGDREDNPLLLRQLLLQNRNQPLPKLQSHKLHQLFPNQRQLPFWNQRMKFP